MHIYHARAEPQRQGGTYEGEWSNRTPNGQGRMVYSDGSVYVGGWKDFKFHGWGKLVQEGGVIYEGEWREGRMHGTGRIETPSTTNATPANVEGGVVGASDQEEFKTTRRAEKPVAGLEGLLADDSSGSTPPAAASSDLSARS